MSRGGGKPVNDVKRQARVKQLRLELDKQFRLLRQHRDAVLETDAVERCADMLKRVQSKHEFMAYPERTDSIAELQETLDMKTKYISELRDQVTRREAEILRQKHPGILEVTDVTKATNLAESMFELYTVNWSDLYDGIRGKVPEKTPNQTILGGLRDLMKVCYETCIDLSNKQRSHMRDVLHMDSQHMEMTAPLRLRLIESQKEASPFTLSFVHKAIKTEIVTNYSPLMKRLQLSPFKSPLVEFLERYTELCWYTQIRDPPVVMAFSLLSDHSLYEPFSNKGRVVDFVVWPVMFLYDNGPLLAKGVAMFTLGINAETMNEQNLN